MLEKILELMEKNHVTAKQLTSDLGLSGSAISEWKKGKGKPSTDAVVKIARYFNVSTDYILGIEGEQKEKPAPTDGDGLSEKDVRLIAWFRSLPPEKRKAILMLGEAPEGLDE